ncbi:hypothetical protein LLEC1_05938 [Akanthomyces lecanii]|uniref:Uncharacterized protein n=1 Tax=Cordyceps confragosa TaxID=2714763 RepID=A0A179IB86_CORDF|nr:hypothetical protein LLEC1_05938 [Akanthomyces lecanii]
MCKKAVCDTCKKSTWWGCGSHVPMVMDAIPEAERCGCDPRVERDGKQYPPMAKSPLQGRRRGALDKGQEGGVVARGRGAAAAALNEAAGR